MKTHYIIKTTNDMFRAHEGAKYPWTEHDALAMQFPTAQKADDERRFYAGIGARPVDSYQVIEVLVMPDGTHAHRDITGEA